MKILNVEDLEPKIKALIIRYLSDQITKDEKSVLLEWLKESDENRRLFIEYRKIFDLSLCANYANRFSERKQDNWKNLNDKIESFEKEEINQKVIRLPYFLKIAAAVLLIFFGGAATYHWLFGAKSIQNLSNIEYEVTAPRGGKSELVLTDGTKVWLNAGSRLRYMANYGINSREVHLVGEGYFSVVKNPKKPFIVQTSGLKIKAFGTSFNVKAYPEEKTVTTTLVEGIVKIEGKGVNLSMKPKEVVIVGKETPKYAPKIRKEAACTTKNVNTPRSVPEANEGLQPNTVKLARNVNTNIYTSWKDNLWIIQSESLENIAVIMARKFNVTVNIKSPELNRYTFTGTFNNETLEQILDIFKLTAPLDYQINKGLVTITEEQKRKATYTNFMK